MEIKGNILSQKDYERLCKTPQEVCSMVSDDLRIKGITRRQAAERLGVQAPVVTIQLSGKKYFGNKTAAKYSEEFGYNPIFLKTGIGYLNTKPQLDSRILSGRVPAVRTRAVTSSYMKYIDLKAKFLELEKNYELASRERDKALKSLAAEKLRNEKLNARIERLMDRLED